jgi:ribose transport system ATP-binding protein
LYVSHHIDEVLSLADRVTVLRNGRRVATWEVTRADSAGLVEMMTGSAPTESAVVTQADQTSTEPALRLDDVSSNVLRQFDLVVRPGEIVGVAGLNGSGRDELCGAIFGGRRRSGEVRVAGSPLPPMRPDLAVSMGVGYVSANRVVDGLIMSMTITENLTLVDLSRYRRYMRLRRAVERADAVGLVGRLGVRTPNVNASVEALSGGNQQKVVMGKWLRIEPKVLLLDEPTQGVDVAAKADLHGLITQAAAQGAAVVITSSDEEELARLCHRVVVLRRGRAVAQHCWPDIVAARITHDCLSDRACAEEGNDHDGNH